MADESAFVAVALKAAEEVLQPPLSIRRGAALLYEVTVDNNLALTVDPKNLCLTSRLWRAEGGARAAGQASANNRLLDGAVNELICWHELLQPFDRPLDVCASWPPFGLRPGVCAFALPFQPLGGAYE